MCLSRFCNTLEEVYGSAAAFFAVSLVGARVFARFLSVAWAVRFVAWLAEGIAVAVDKDEVELLAVKVGTCHFDCHAVAQTVACATATAHKRVVFSSKS